MAEHWSMSASMLIHFPKRRTGIFDMTRLDSFADLAEHYASLTSADAFAGAFGSEIASSQLSIHDETSAEDIPDADDARHVAAQVTGAQKRAVWEKRVTGRVQICGGRLIKKKKK